MACLAGKMGMDQDDQPLKVANFMPEKIPKCLPQLVPHGAPMLGLLDVNLGDSSGSNNGPGDAWATE